MNDGGSAFPSPTGNTQQDGGVSVRDYFAVAALQGMARLDGRGFNEQETARDIAHWCYVLADAMLKQRGLAASE